MPRTKRDRYREMLSSPRLRPKFVGKLARFADFDPRFRVPIPSNKLSADNILRELKRRHSPETVFAISEDPSLDQKELPLVEALGGILGRGMGTVLSCIPGRLAFVETEDERFILERNDADELKTLQAWFGKNLNEPTSFGRDKLRLGICWFKTDATEHIGRIWEMVRILERHGIWVQKITTDRPGYMIYEDEWQIVAEPFRKDMKSR